jgi:hypothetical protein
VMLSLGPITEGYLLINSKLHYDCCGAFTGVIAEEFDLIVTAVQRIQTQVYGHCIFYEHGRAGSCLQYSEPSTHCFHAHLHCVPVALNVNPLVSSTHSSILVNSFKEFRFTYQKTKTPYLLVSDDEMKIHFIKHDIRKQYLRHLVSTHLGEERFWDWVNYQRWDVINAGHQKLKPYFHKCYVSL